MNQDSAAVSPGIALEKLPGQLHFWHGFHALSWGLLGGLAVALVGWLTEEAMQTPLPWLRWAVLTLGTLVLLGWWYGGLRFKHYQAHFLQHEGLVLHSGVWWRSESWVPIARLQHLDVRQGPVDRSFGMASLVVHTAGTHDHALHIVGLPLAYAQALREALMPKVQGAHE